MGIEKILGLDLTKKMVSWALVQSDPDNNDNNKIIDCGGYTFKAGEIPKTGESPNVVRRNARLMRRTIDKRQARKKAVRKLFAENNMLSKELIDTETFSNWITSKKKLVSPWDLRAKGLDILLKGEDFARALYSITGGRGYQFTKAEENSAEDGDSSKMRDATKVLVQNMQDNNCRTIGEYLALYENRKRNTHLAKTKSNGEIVLSKDGDPILIASYDRSISRYLLKQEVKALFEAQRRLGSTFTSEDFEQQYNDITFYMPDPQSTENLVGYCSIFPKEKRAAKTQYEAELQVVLTRILNCRIIEGGTGYESQLLDFTDIESLLDLAKSKETITHTDLRKFINLDDKYFFKGLKYKGKAAKAKKKKKDDGLFEEQGEIVEDIVLDLKEAEKIPFVKMNGYHELKRLFANDTDSFNKIATNIDAYNAICWVLTVEKGDNSRINRLKPILTKLFDEAKIEEIANKLICANPKVFKDHHSLSLKALKPIVSLMLEGNRYDEAIAVLGVEVPSKEKTLFMPPLNKTGIEVTSPRTIRMVASMRKVVNEIIRFHGGFNKVHIEIGRDLNSLNETKIIENAQNERRKAKDEAAKRIKEFFGDKVKLSSRNITKYMLWEQQNGRCIYTGEVLNLEKLFEFEGGPYKIDYILPRSRSFDESFGNMVLTTLEAKLSKADKTPFEWFGKDEQKWQDYKAFCNSPATLAKLGKGKVNRLTKENFDENSSKEYMKRSIENDRMYAAKLVKEIFEKHMVLPESPNNKQQVYTRNSRLTSELKKQWVSYAKQEEYTGARANILNAIIIAFSGQNMVRKLAQYYKWIETKYEKDSKPSFEKPYAFFDEDLEKFLQLDRTSPDKNGVIRKRLLVAIAPNRTVTGETNGATVISPKVAKEGKGVPVRQGKAIATTGGDIARGDIYFQDGQNHLVVVYARDMGGKKIPNVSTRGIVMKPENFLFSLCNGDIVSIEDELFQVKSFNANDGRLIGTYLFTGIDKSVTISNKNVVKYNTSPLGFYNSIAKEKLQNTING